MPLHVITNDLQINKRSPRSNSPLLMTVELFPSFCDYKQPDELFILNIFASVSNNILLSQQLAVLGLKGTPLSQDLRKHCQVISPGLLLSKSSPTVYQRSCPFHCVVGTRHSGGGEKLGRGGLSMARLGGNTWTYKYISLPVGCQLSTSSFLTRGVTTTITELLLWALHSLPRHYLIYISEEPHFTERKVSW